MKYTYAYKTSDGMRHEASMEAKCREDVFAELRKQGIKAIKVIAADGSKANGEVRGIRLRVVVMFFAVVVLGVGLVAVIEGSRSHVIGIDNNSVRSPRHQIYGDPALIEEIEAGHLETYLPNPGDRLLAWFAEPGRVICPKGIDPRRLTTEQLNVLTAYAKNGLDADHDIDALSEPQREVRELKQIVNGMREEFRDYLANGNGTPRSFLRRLIERTHEEMQIFERTRRELEYEKSESVWEEKNQALRRIGLRTIVNPREESR